MQGKIKSMWTSLPVFYGSMLCIIKRNQDGDLGRSVILKLANCESHLEAVARNADTTLSLGSLSLVKFNSAWENLL